MKRIGSSRGRIRPPLILLTVGKLRVLDYSLSVHARR